MNKRLIAEHRYSKSEFYDIIIHHIDHNIPINESVMRLGSESFTEYVCFVRELYEDGFYEPINEHERFLMERLSTGSKGVYDGKEVVLDTPFRLRGDKKEFGVYRPSKTGKKDDKGRRKAVLVKWGDPNLPVRNDDKDASKSFWARHKCDTKTDQYTAGWWACYAPQKFGDVLKLKGGKSRW